MVDEPTVLSESTDGPELLQRHLRGSNLLLAGRFLSIVVNLVVQVIVVRYLSKTDYGAFAYALALVQSIELVIALGLDRSITRFVAIYDEQGRTDKLLGVLILQVGTIVMLGLAVVLTVVGLRGWIEGALIDDHRAVLLLVTLVVLAPLTALDTVMYGLLAVFAKPKAIFLRRHVLTPLLRLGVVLLTVVGSFGVSALATGYVVAGLFGTAFYVHLLVRLLRRRGVFAARHRGITVPYREVFTFTASLLTTEVMFLVSQTINTLLLGRYGGTDEVASYRAVLAPARTNQVVITTFAILFVPLASRLFARADHDGLAKLYWRTAAWMALASFPIFALTSPLSGPVTVNLFGDRYEGSATYLALLSTAYYFNAALGFNGMILKVMAKLRYVIAINVIVLVAAVVLNLVLVPRYGALGAAWATALTLVLHNLLKQGGLLLGTGISLLDPQQLRVLAGVGVGAAALWGLSAGLDVGPVWSVLAAGVVTVALFRGNRQQLALLATFPELRRIPLLNRWLA